VALYIIFVPQLFLFMQREDHNQLEKREPHHLWLSMMGQPMVKLLGGLQMARLVVMMATRWSLVGNA